MGFPISLTRTKPCSVTRDWRESIRAAGGRGGSPTVPAQEVVQTGRAGDVARCSICVRVYVCVCVCVGYVSFERSK